jgi:hypothetical protein
LIDNSLVEQLTNKGTKVAEQKTSLKAIKAQYSPDQNPLMQSVVVPVKKSRVRSSLADVPLINARSGEVVAATMIHQFVDVDTDQFVKVFASGIAAAYELSRPGQRVFHAVLGEYEKAPMSGGFADSVFLAWFNGGLSGRAIGMSDRTFARGLRELLDKSFLAPREPNLYWVNPSLFFKGDRVMFVKEYRRTARVVAKALPASLEPSTPDVIAGGDPASFPRPIQEQINVESREKTESQHPAKPPVVSRKGSGFSNKKKKNRR